MKEYHVTRMDAMVDKLNSLPGIGPRTAQRLAYHILHMSDDQLRSLLDTLWDAQQNLRECSVCCNLTDQELCPLCQSEARDRSLICVVEEAKDVPVIERSGEYNGLYHVLHGKISPLSGIGPDQLRIKQLVGRVTSEKVREVILANNATLESETTAMYIARLLKPLGVKVTRLGVGLPSGGELEYADDYTLKMALEGRREL